MKYYGTFTLYVSFQVEGVMQYRVYLLHSFNSI